MVDKDKYRWIVISAAFAAFMSTLDSYIVNISLPTIAKYFHVGVDKASLITLSFLIFSTSTLLLVGKLVDIMGVRRVFIAGYAIFTVGSLFCGIPPSLAMLIAARCLQGIGGAMIVNAGYSSISRFLPREITGWGFSILSIAASLGITTGAPLGGFITGFFSWRWIFLINVPIGIIAIILAHKVIPQTGPSGETAQGEKKGFDFFGAVLSLVGLSLLVYGLNSGKEHGWTSVTLISLLLASAAVLVFFVVWERGQAEPLLDLKLLGNSGFALASVATLLAYMFMSGNAFLLPFYLETLKELNSEKAGMVLMIWSIAYMVTNFLSGRLSDKISSSILCSSAMISAAMSALFFVVTIKQSGLTMLTIFLVWMAVSYAMFIAPNNKYVLGMAQQGEQGMASGIYNTMSRLGLVLGVCIFQALFSQGFPHHPETGIHVHSVIPSETLLRGFSHAYTAAIIVCVGAFIFSFLGRSKQRHHPQQ
jgi:EmrB/QacA subfamily drug resistance transporter